VSDELSLEGKTQAVARTSLGLTGPSIPTREQLRFQLDHALARDAVHAQMDVTGLLHGLRERQMDGLALRSAASGGSGENNRRVYLRRPDLGRILHGESQQALRELEPGASIEPDVVFVVVDGLSALAVERHALPVMDAVLPLLGAQQLQVGPVCLVQQGRVAVGDEIGSLLHAKLVIVLIGERPGLSAPDSLGVYITWAPRPGRSDAERNCISNVRLEGLSYAEAAQRIAYYVEESRRLQATGIALKDPVAGYGQQLAR
jgi:ethanolamine ammonia-lyase small subunit